MWRCFAALTMVMAQQPSKDWCNDGIQVPDFQDDSGNLSVDLMVVQAPLFSTNPRIGTKLRWLNLYHTALVVKQSLPGLAVKNWTIEFDSVTNVLGAVLPHINGSNLSWNNDARYCVTQGVLWGEAHWSQMFDSVLRLNASAARKIFTDFIPSVNNTQHLTKPLYQLWRVEGHDKETPLIKDITCGDGVNWILDYASRVLQTPPAFELKFTSIVVPADRISPVQVNGAEWPAVVKYFQGMSNVTHGQPLLDRILELLRLMPVHYIYDSNAQEYFKVEGNHFPWLESKYRQVPLEGPWVTSRQIHPQGEIYVI